MEAAVCDSSKGQFDNLFLFGGVDRVLLGKCCCACGISPTGFVTKAAYAFSTFAARGGRECCRMLASLYRAQKM